MPDRQPAPPPSAAPALSGTWRIAPPQGPLTFSLDLPGDMLAGLCTLAAAALLRQPVPVWGLAESEPLIRLRGVLAQLGVQIVQDSEGWLNATPPEDGLQAPPGVLHCGAEPDTLLVALGLVAGAGIAARLELDSPGADCRAVEQGVALLRELGAECNVEVLAGGCVVTTHGARLQGAALHLPLSTAALKPLAVFAAFQAEGASTLHEPCALHDHAERALRTLGAQLSRKPHTLVVEGGQALGPRPLKVPPDISAGLACALRCAARRDAELLLPMAGANPGRTVWLRSLQRCGASVLRERDWQFGSEPVCTLRIGGMARLGPLTVAPNAAGSLLVEAPALAAFATQCRGVSRLRGLRELRAGVPDRLALGAQLLREFGARVELLDDGLEVAGGGGLAGAEVNCGGDRALAQLALTAALLAEGPSTLHGMEALDRPWPGLRSTVQGFCATATAP